MTLTSFSASSSDFPEEPVVLRRGNGEGGIEELCTIAGLDSATVGQRVRNELDNIRRLLAELDVLETRSDQAWVKREKAKALQSLRRIGVTIMQKLRGVVGHKQKGEILTEEKDAIEEELLFEVHELGNEISADLEQERVAAQQARETYRETTGFRKRIGRNPHSRKRF